MADLKISELNELTSVDVVDEFVVVDKSDTSQAASGTTKRVKKSSLFGNMGAGGAAGGDLAGVYPNPEVVAIWGKDITTPGAGEDEMVLVYDHASEAFIWTALGADGINDPIDPQSVAATWAGRITLSPSSASESGIVIQRPNDNAWGIGQDYAEGQFIAFLRKQAGPADANHIAPEPRMLFRVDRTGGHGTAGGVHVGTGLDQDASYPTQPAALWINPYIDVTPLVIDNPTTAQAATWLHNFIEVDDLRPGTPYSVFDVQPSGRTRARAGLDIIVRDTTHNSLVLTALAAQTGSLVQMRRSDGTVAIETVGDASYTRWVKNNGTTTVAYIASGNAGAFGVRATFQAGDPGTIPLYLTAAAAQTADIQEWANSAGTILSRVNKAGYFMTRKTSAPADGDFANSEVGIWLDDTAAAPKVKWKMKSSDGTVRSVTVPDETEMLSGYRSLGKDRNWALGTGAAQRTDDIVYTAGQIALATVGNAFGVIRLDPAKFPTIVGKTLKIRIAATVSTNSVDPTKTFTLALKPVSTRGGASGSAPQVTGVGGAVCSTTVANPGASAGGHNESADADFPAAGDYVVTLSTSGALAAGALADGNIELEYHYV